MNAKAEIKNQIVGALAGAKFSIATPEDLLNAFPNGPDTICRSGEVTLRAGDAGGVLSASDFPFESAESVAETIVSRAL